ncbi:MAG: GPR endopeptidase [Defluviitaleaceae bacterium]|nr:GPR endopeptidase [Defluviitaleaceae bacterium]
MKKRNVVTDLAIEAHEMLCEEQEASFIDGVVVNEQEFCNGEIRVVHVKITNENGENQLRKPIGNYITIESAAVKERDKETHEEIIKVLADIVGNLHGLKSDGVILVVGLGNRNVTPDALGPRAAEKVLVTRHLKNEGIIPKELEGKVRAVASISPGVLGITGIETYEIVKGVTDRIKPDLIIAIDALAARELSRINSTIQISDTGISPGAGMGNKRVELNEKTLGVKVIAIGVPTVVDAATMVNDVLDGILSDLQAESNSGAAFYSIIKELSSEEKYPMILSALEPYDGNMFVTPKEVDDVVNDLSVIIANGLNIALNQGVGKGDVWRYG